MTLGMIVLNRGFFPDHLAQSAHQEMKAVLEAAGVSVVALTETDSKYGAVETRQEAAKCAALFAENRGAINGVIVTLPNFADERVIENNTHWN
jgi:L-fucose isomerase-like protein